MTERQQTAQGRTRSAQNAVQDESPHGTLRRLYGALVRLAGVFRHGAPLAGIILIDRQDAGYQLHHLPRAKASQASQLGNLARRHCATLRKSPRDKRNSFGCHGLTLRLGHAAMIAQKEVSNQH